MPKPGKKKWKIAAGKVVADLSENDSNDVLLLPSYPSTIHGKAEAEHAG
jgi:hypothetical protein